nr:hypothetical protein [Tanacetum cinerariifolium]
MSFFKRRQLHDFNYVFNGAETDIMWPQVHRGGSKTVAIDKDQEVDDVMSLKEYLVETMKRGQQILKKPHR